jgi:hypothetical protein
MKRQKNPGMPDEIGKINLKWIRFNCSEQYLKRGVKDRSGYSKPAQIAHVALGKVKARLAADLKASWDRRDQV